MPTRLLVVLVLTLSIQMVLKAQTATQRVVPVYDGRIGVIQEIPLKAPGVVGSVYLNDDWINADVYIKNHTTNDIELKQMPIKIDLKTDVVEILTDQGIKVLGSSRISRIEFVNKNLQRQILVSGDQFTVGGVKATGICSIITAGKLGLVERYFVKIIKADYNVALSVGSRDDKIVKDAELFLLKDNNMIAVSKRAALEQMIDQEEKIKQYIKKNDLRLKSKQDIKQVIDFYNSL